VTDEQAAARPCPGSNREMLGCSPSGTTTSQKTNSVLETIRVALLQAPTLPSPRGGGK